MIRKSNEYDMAKCNFCGAINLASEMFVLKRPETSNVKLKEMFWCVNCYNTSDIQKMNNKDIQHPL